MELAETMVEIYYSMLILATGASVGSFLNVVADRLPNGRSLVKPGSSCDVCHTSLGAIDMVPVLSFLGLRGKCRHCGTRIPGRLPIVELATGVLFALLYLRYGFGVEFAIFAVATALLMAVTLIDLDHRLILNKIVFPALLVLLVLSPFWTELGDERSFFGAVGLLGSFANSLSAGLGYLLLIFVVRLVNPRGMGMGDVKLAGVLGLLVGFPLVFVAFWVTVVAGGLVATYLLLARGMGRKDAIPYGPFMALGAVVAILAGTDIWGWYSDFALGLGG